MSGIFQPKREVLFDLFHGSATVTVTPMFGGKPKTRTMKITRDQWKAWQDGEYIQNVMSHLTVEEREFLMSGLDQADWDRMKEDGDE